MYPTLYAQQCPEKPAYVFPHIKRTVTYRELESDSNRVAHLLTEECVLEVGDGIALLMENHPWFFKIVWAAQRSGLYYTPVSTRFASDEVRYIIQNSDAKILFVSPACLPLVQAHLNQLPALRRIFLIDTNSVSASDSAKVQDLNSAIHSLSDQPITREFEGAEMFYSSGTTGRPKGVRMPLLRAPLGTIPDLVKRRMELHQIHEAAVYLSPAPLYHSAPVRYNMMVMRCGGTCIIMEKFREEAALELIERYRVTHSQWVPTMFVRLLKLPVETRQKYDLTSMQIALHAAAPCPQRVKQQMLDWWGPIITEYYSGTEANGATNITASEWLAHVGSVGRPLIGSLKILDDAGGEVPVGQPGGVYFYGGMDFEYYKDPEKTAAAKSGDGLSTLGDIGYVDADGYLYLTDRKAYTIISGGVNIYPQEIEDLIITHPKVADVAVFGVPDEEFGEQVKAVVQLMPTVMPSVDIETEIRTFCREHLSHLKCPKSVDFEERLPRHPTGKLYKRLLKERYWP